MTDADNLLISLTSVKLSDMWEDLAVNLFLSTELDAGSLLTGIAIFSPFEIIGVMDLTGVEMNLEVPMPFQNLNEETDAFFLPTDSKTSWLWLEPSCNNSYHASDMSSKN